MSTSHRLARGDDIAERLLLFALSALDVSKTLRNGAGERHIALQLVRSATSAGANYEEARGAESRADFAHKAALAAKETREAGYWLTLASRSGRAGRELSGEIDEAQQLAAILGASVRTARRNSR